MPCFLFYDELTKILYKDVLKNIFRLNNKNLWQIQELIFIHVTLEILVIHIQMPKNCIEQWISSKLLRSKHFYQTFQLVLVRFRFDYFYLINPDGRVFGNWGSVSSNRRCLIETIFSTECPARVWGEPRLQNSPGIPTTRPRRNILN